MLTYVVEGSIEHWPAHEHSPLVYMSGREHDQDVPVGGCLFFVVEPHQARLQAEQP